MGTASNPNFVSPGAQPPVGPYTDKMANLSAERGGGASYVDNRGFGGGKVYSGRPQPDVMPRPSSPTAGQQPWNVNTAAAGGLQSAMAGTQQAMGFRPRGVSAGQLSSTDLTPYTNPYENQVVQGALGDIERTRLMQQNQIGASAGAANAFGGSRHGLVEAETNRAALDQAARTGGQLRQAGYGQAQAAAQRDISGRMQASLANQAAGMQGNQMRLGAAGQMGQLGNQAFQTGQAINTQQMQHGLLQQAMQQRLIDAAKGQWGQYTGSPVGSLGPLFGGVGAAGPSAGETTVSSRQPGIFDFLTMGL